MRSLIAIMLCIGSLTACGSSSSENNQLASYEAEAFKSDEVPYNQFRQKSVHNAYQRKESLEEMYNDYGLRSIELDIHGSKMFRPGISRDWYVYHEWFDLNSKVDTFSEGLRRLTAVSRDDQDPISLFVDIKSKFDNGTHRFEDLDNLLRSVVGSRLYQPKDIIARCPGTDSLEAAVDHCGWPTRKEIRGKILVVLTGGDANPYAADSNMARTRAAFVAPSPGNSGEIGKFPHAIFFNLSPKNVFNSDMPEILFSRGKVIRTWDLNSNGDWQKALAKPVAQLATNKVNTKTDPWAIVPDALALFY